MSTRTKPLAFGPQKLEADLVEHTYDGS